MRVEVINPFEKKLEEDALKDNREWKATKKQRAFIQLPFEVSEAGYGGALGSGKTDVLLLLPLIYQFHENKRYRGLMVRRTFPELEQEVIQRSKEYFPSVGAVYNESKKWWKFPAGGYDRFGHIEHDKDVKKYDGSQYALERWDEATSHSKYQYEYLVYRRNRAPAGSGLPSITRWGSNPGGIGHTYFRQRFLDPYYKKNAKLGSLIRDKSKGTIISFLPATATDNPHLLETNPDYFKRLQNISSEAERRALILGDWYTFEGQVFEEFRLEPLPGEPLNARHVIRGFQIPHWWPKIVSIDWGYNAATFVIWWAIGPNGRVYIYRTFMAEKTKIREWTRDISKLSAGEIDNIRDVRICFSATQDRGLDQTIFQQVAEALEDSNFQCGLTLGDRNRIAGKQLVHEYLRWKPVQLGKEIIGVYSAELAARIYRQHGDTGLREYQKLFEPTPEERNLPKLQIFKSSPEGKSTEDLTDVIPTCVYADEDEKGKKEDVKEFNGDDAYDCLRIGLYAIRDYFSDSSAEYSKITKYNSADEQRREQIAHYEHLLRSGHTRLAEQIMVDAQTRYYRQCEVIEKANKEVTSVRRRSFRRR